MSGPMNPSHLKVKRLVELPLLPPEQADEAQTYAVVDSKDYKLDVGVLVDAAIEGMEAAIPSTTDSLVEGVQNLYVTPAQRSKLNGIEEGAQVNTVDSVNGKTGAVTLVSSDVGAEAAFSKGSLIAGTGIALSGTLTDRLVGAGNITITATGGGGGGGGVDSVAEGAGITVDSTDPSAPVVGLSDMAQATIKGRASGAGTGAPVDLSASQVRTIINVADGATAGATWGTNLSSIPANITSWASIAPANKADANSVVNTTDNQTGIAGNKTATGVWTLAGTNTTPLVIERTSAASNANIKYTTTGGSAYAGLGNTGLWAIGSSADLAQSGNRWFHVTSAGAFVLGQEVYHAGNVPTWNQNTTGNAATATRLATARTIGGVSFNGTANINLPGVNTAGNQDTSGNAATATILATTRTINGTSFNGSANITTANWGTSRTLTIGATGKAVNGSANVTWSLADIGAAGLGSNTFTGAQDLTGGLYLNGTTNANRSVWFQDGSGNSMGAIYNSTSGGINMWTSGSILLRTNGNTSTNQASLTTAGLFTAPTIADTYGNVRKPKHRTVSGSVNLDATLDLNGVVEKTNTSALTWTIPAGMASPGDMITVVNSGSSGNITLARGSGVALFRNGTNADITVAPGNSVTIVRCNTTDRWQA